MYIKHSYCKQEQFACCIHAELLSIDVPEISERGMKFNYVLTIESTVGVKKSKDVATNLFPQQQ